MVNKTDPHGVYDSIGETDVNQIITQMSLQSLISAQKKYKVVNESNIWDFETWGSDSFLREQQPCHTLRIRGHCVGKNCSRWCQETESVLEGSGVGLWLWASNWKKACAGSLSAG